VEVWPLTQVPVWLDIRLQQCIPFSPNLFEESQVPLVMVVMEMAPQSGPAGSRSVVGLQQYVMGLQEHASHCLHSRTQSSI
jgi:hypothetical protein